MNLADIYDSIREEIWNFKNLTGKSPSCIFVSTELARYMKNDVNLSYIYNKSDGIVAKYYGVEIKLYNHPEPQYYLAEGPGKFKVFKENHCE